MITNSKIGLAYAILASGLLARRDNGLSDKQPEPAQTNTALPPEPPVSRQVRRQRERLAAKGRTDKPPQWMLSPHRKFGRSAYMPHVGGGRYAIDRAGD